MNQMNRNRLNIGTYYLHPYARTEKHVREMAECGIDFVCNMDYDVPALDLFSKYGIGAIVTGILPGWWGGDGNNGGKMREMVPMSKYEQAAASFKNHPAIWGIDTGDEPSALDFPYYGEVIHFTKRTFPECFPYLNLYPNYASVAKNNAAETVNQLGTRTYAEHIEAYIHNVDTDYICYDYYVYSSSVSGAYENLRIVSDACRRTGRSMWIVLQVNSHVPEKWITENQLRFQAFSAMAFGAENIIWACYTAGWWHNQVLDENGEKTEQYDKLKKVNGEIRAIADAYMKYRRTDTHFVGFAENAKDLEKLSQEPVAVLNTGAFMDLTASAPVVIGQMKARDGSDHYALMVCAADDPYDQNHSETILRFRADDRTVRVTNANGCVTLEKAEDGYYTVTLPSSAGLLIEA